MKFKIVEFLVEDAAVFTYPIGYGYTYLHDPETGKYYELAPGEIELDASLVREVESD